MIIKEIHVPQHNTTYKNIEVKTPSDLKHWHELLNPDSHYFERSTMKFFGDKMANYGVREVLPDRIELYRRKPVNGGLTSSAFFSIPDFKKV